MSVLEEAARSAPAIAAALGGGLALALGLHAVLHAPRALGTSEVGVAIPDLPPELEGYTIAVLADLHHGPGTTREMVRRAVDIAREARPDLVALLGDYGTSFAHRRRLNARLYEMTFRALAPELARLEARDGVIAVIGNHDHWFDPERTARWLESLGARVLVNEHVVVRRGDASLVIGGVDDALEGEIDPNGGCALAPADAPTIVLAHHPDTVLQLTGDRRIDLVLSGHTHGGQIVLPGYGAPLTLSKVCTRSAASGWVPNARAPLYVSRGVGGQIPLRFNCPPEVVLVRLSRGAR